MRMACEHRPERDGPPPLDPVEEADVESFPASDPPAWTDATVTRIAEIADEDEEDATGGDSRDPAGGRSD
ncbi:MAG: hypothetical protein KatS3mg119_1573 [Rhodothalassiaceae bacterium]|nr:MAG: hypothetical protein KatS3mg119_1573 [Rhodothalassiaceae bacterium]